MTGQLRHTAIIITMDRHDELRLTVESLVRQTLPPQQLLIVDASGEPVRREDFKSLPFECVIMHTQPSICAQKNLGLSHANADVISFFDDDVTLERDYCRFIVERFAKDEEGMIGGIGGVMRNPPNRSALEVLFRKFFLLQTDQGKNRFRLSGFPDPGFSFKEETTVEFLASTAVSFRSSAVGDVRFDEQFTGYTHGLPTGRGFSEDILFSSMLGISHRLCILPAATFIHRQSEKNREAIDMTQQLYVYSLRRISFSRMTNFIGRLARTWALLGQGLLCLVQSIRYGNWGYVKGYARALTLSRVRVSAEGSPNGRMSS